MAQEPRAKAKINGGQPKEHSLVVQQGEKRYVNILQYAAKLKIGEDKNLGRSQGRKTACP
jgi:hypothetical protein